MAEIFTVAVTREQVVSVSVLCDTEEEAIEAAPEVVDWDDWDIGSEECVVIGVGPLSTFEGERYWAGGETGDWVYPSDEDLHG